MARLSLLLVVVLMSHAVMILARVERLDEEDRHLLKLLRRLEGRQIEESTIDVRLLQVTQTASTGEREMNLTNRRDVNVDQSSALRGWRSYQVALKAVDGRYNDTNFLGEDGEEYGGSCTVTKSEENPRWIAAFREELCISKVSILNIGDGFSERLTGAVIRFGYYPYFKLDKDTACGSPVTADEAAVRGGTVEVECSEPIGGRNLVIGIPADNATLQLCEVRVWAIPMDQCPDEIKAETELDLTDFLVDQSSAVRTGKYWDAHEKVIDGQYNNSNLLGEGGEIYGGSCTITRAQKDPYWGMVSHKDYCISKVWILNRGDGYSERLTGAVVRIGTERTANLNNNTACGSPVTAEQAAVPGGTIEFKCSQPIKGNIFIIGIPADNATLQLCELRVWAVPMKQCFPDFDECSSDPCQNGATCVDGINEFSCTCAAGFTGPLCEDDLDECSSDPCQNGATCVDGINKYTCTCPAGFTGPLCQHDIEECGSSPCQNGATCVDNTNGFSCACAVGFTGPLCEDDVDECGSDPCLNGATCVDGVNEVSCTCAAGYSGVVCEIDINECNSNPCQNGVCVEGVGSFTCECSTGYEGATCETNIDECVSNPCQNGATCVDGINEVSCTCPEGFTGSVCETAVTRINRCTTNPCKNGICIAYGVDGFKCACAPGYQGTVCEINIDECSSNPCQNDAKCVDGINKVSCICAPGFSGELCQNEHANGPPDNMPQLPQGLSPAGVGVEIQTSYMQMNLVTEYCVKKVVVHKSGDCTSNRLTGAVVRGGTSSTSLNNSVCGTPLTAQQAEIRRSTVDFVCDPPMTAKFVTVDIPLLRVSQKPLCEVTIEQATPGPC